jgi:hypothetical protein
MVDTAIKKYNHKGRGSKCAPFKNSGPPKGILKDTV